MNGQKSSPYEGGVRAPCFVRWPKTIPSGKIVDAQTSHVDWMPTFCELAGASLPEDRTIDGKSLVSLLKSGHAKSHHRYVYHTWDRYFPNPDRRWGISDSRWKLLGIFGKNAQPAPNRWRLFDLKSDPGETNNLAKKHPEIVRRLRSEFVRWFDDATEGVRYAPIRIPLGYPGVDRTEISPSWATWTGEHINYTFDGYDWDTIDGWKTPGEKATWRLEVFTPGKYQVRLSYGSRPQDAGGMLSISVGDSELDHRVHATTTSEQFEWFDAGQLQMPKGKVELTAKVKSASSGELMRLNAITLDRLE
jgi:hypothetical protein